MVKKLLHTRMRVNDLDETVAFYKEILGLQEVSRHKSPRGAQLVFLKVPGREDTLEICHYPASGPVEVQPDLMHVAFEVEDMGAFEKHIKSKGYAFSDGPTQSGSGSIIAFVDAPDKYEVELIQRKK